MGIFGNRGGDFQPELSGHTDDIFLESINRRESGIFGRKNGIKT